MNPQTMAFPISPVFSAVNMGAWVIKKPAIEALRLIGIQHDG